MMKLKIASFAALSLFFVSLFLQRSYGAGQDSDVGGPLGLTWGSTADQTQRAGVELKGLSNPEYGVTFSATNLPRVLSDQETTIISFGYDDTLWRVVAISKAFPNDPVGARLVSRYQDLLATLADKYGPPHSVHSLGESIYKEPQYFLAGIRGGNTQWYSDFSTPNLTVQLSLRAEDSSTGRWSVIYENKSLRNAFEAAKKKREKGTL